MSFRYDLRVLFGQSYEPTIGPPLPSRPKGIEGYPRGRQQTAHINKSPHSRKWSPPNLLLPTPKVVFPVLESRRHAGTMHKYRPRTRGKTCSLNARREWVEGKKRKLRPVESGRTQLFLRSIASEDLSRSTESS
jgi:hypothetical protein